jgi:hypothetical protein
MKMTRAPLAERARTHANICRAEGMSPDAARDQITAQLERDGTDRRTAETQARRAVAGVYMGVGV